MIATTVRHASQAPIRKVSVMQLSFVALDKKTALRSMTRRMQNCLFPSPGPADFLAGVARDIGKSSVQKAP